MSSAPTNNSDTKNNSHQGPQKKEFASRPLVWGVIVLVIAAVVFIIVQPKETELSYAVRMIKQNKAAAAVPILERLAIKHPEEPDVHPWLAQGYLATQRYAEARTELDTAIRLRVSPKSLIPMIQAFTNYYQIRGDFQDAEKLYQAAVRIGLKDNVAKERSLFYIAYADHDLQNERYEDAAKHLQTAHELEAGLDEETKKGIKMRQADCLRRMAAVAEVTEKDDDKALKLLEQSLAISDETLTHKAIATIYDRKGNQQEAIKHYQAVAQADPNNLEVWHHLVDLLLARKEYDKAQEALNELSNKERSPENYELLANVCLKLSNYAGAVRGFEEAANLSPTLPLLEKLKKTLLLWAESLSSEGKTQEAESVRGHADRVSEQIAVKLQEKEAQDAAKNKAKMIAEPISILFSRNWLAKDSITPEGKLRIRNSSDQPIEDLTLTAVFYDRTARARNGSVDLPVASPSHFFGPQEEKWLYFSCPSTVKRDHHLTVIIYSKGKLLKEFPVAKY